MIQTHSHDNVWDKASTAVTVAFLALFVSVLNTVGVLICMFHEDIVIQEANPEINVDRPATSDELHDQRVRDFLNRNTHGVDDADELPGTADGDPSPASGDR